MHKTKNNKKCYTCTRHEQHKSHRIYQIFQEVSSISYLTHSSLTNFSSSGAVFSNSSGSSISRVAIFAFHFSLRAFFFLRGKRVAQHTNMRFTHDDPAAIISRLNTFAFFPVEMSRCRAMTRWWVGSLNSFHSLFHFGVLSPGVGNK